MLRGQPLPLLAFEGTCLLAFLVLAAIITKSPADTGQLVPLDPSALTAGPTKERWFGIFFQEHHVGYSVSRMSDTIDGGQLYEQRASFRFAAAGQVQEIITAGAATVDVNGGLQRFDFFMAADPVRMSIEGAVQGNEIVMDVNQAGETSTLRFPVSRPPQVGLSFQRSIAERDLKQGDSFEVPYFDPVTLAEGVMKVNVTGVEIVAGGEEAWWLERDFQGVSTRMLTTTSGEVLREESALGLQSVRMSREEAQDIPTDDRPVDLIAKTAVHLDGRIKDPRRATRVDLRIVGEAAGRVPEWPPLQVREGDHLTVRQAPPELLIAGTPAAAEEGTEPGLDEWLLDTPTIPAAHREIRIKAESLVAGAPDRLTAARKLLEFVDTYVEDVPIVGVPNGLDVLNRGQGDCNEHTALFVSLARAARIPSRIAAGVVYSDRVPGTAGLGAFYYHAWPEIRLGAEDTWVPVDPTFGQFPADATHIKLVEGDLDRQIEIMAYMGRLGFEVIDRPAAP